MVTIAIPCYQSNIFFLQQAIQSVLEQTNHEWRLLIVDGNESKDHELNKLIVSFDSEKIKYVRNTADLSMAGNWNFALEQSKTDLVTLLHDDDMLGPEYVAKMLEAASLNADASCFFCDVDIVDDKGKFVYSFPDWIKRFIRPNKKKLLLRGDDGLASLLKGCYVFCPSICFRKSKLETSPFRHKWKMVTDLDFYFQTLREGGSMEGLSDKLYKYRRHDQNQTAILTANLGRFEEEVSLYSEISEQVKDYWPTAAKIAHKKSIIKAHLLFQIVRSAVNFRFKQANMYSTFLKKLISNGK